MRCGIEHAGPKSRKADGRSGRARAIGLYRRGEALNHERSPQTRQSAGIHRYRNPTGK
ncbi:hypothetical protein GCWU000341_00482 [Oribacterium sp. oral taxon 078 str. F0262]|nr:hypothetical protein GCWU000341_00482 [Oribacterium sp. oral taxon 078 str. F0262]